MGIFDGIAEEITNRHGASARLRLRLAHRFRLQGTSRGRTAEREGSLGWRGFERERRKAGTHLRITANSSVSPTGVTLWSASFDRESEDVFAIQDEISQKVVYALRWN